MEELEKEKLKEEMAGKGSEGSPMHSLGATEEWKERANTMQSSLDVVMKAINAIGAESKENIKINNNFKDQLKKLRDETTKIKESLQKSELRSIEVIGIISAIIALVLVFVDTSNKMPDIKNAYVILLTGTSSLVIFSSLLHLFFDKDYERGKLYYFLLFGIPLIIIIGLGIYILFINK